MYVCFKNKSVSQNFYINLDNEQWEDIRQRPVDLSLSEDKENVPPEPTITGYQYISEHCPPKWFFTKAAAKVYAEVQGFAPHRIKEKKVPAPDKCRLIHLVRAYLTRKKLDEVVRESCYGCQYNMPSQRDHVCLDEESGDAFTHLVHLTDVAENVVKIARALNLKPELYKPEEDTTRPVLDTVPEEYQDFFEKTL